jgi:molybdopterin-guanine dinucleotide biosynthesis protein A
MGTDKALLPHPAGGTWLERTLELLCSLGAPVTLLSRHRPHAVLAQQLAARSGLRIEVISEPPPWEGPLLALSRLMAHHPDQRLLIAPVDMPGLRADSLRRLLNAGATDPSDGMIQLAHDGQRLQPLLGLYPAIASHRDSAEACIACGGRSLLRWLEQGRSWVPVVLDPDQLVNANTPADWPAPG